MKNYSSLRNPVLGNMWRYNNRRDAIPPKKGIGAKYKRDKRVNLDD